MKQQHFIIAIHCVRVLQNLNISVDRTTLIPCRIVDCIDKKTILHEFTCLLFDCDLSIVQYYSFGSFQNHLMHCVCNNVNGEQQ